MSILRRRTIMPSSHRREFLQTSAVAGAAATLVLSQSAHAAGNDLLKVGLVGCGGRGSMAALQAISADENCKLWAMGDAFGDRLESSLNGMQRKDELLAKIDVPPERRFTGFD